VLDLINFRWGSKVGDLGIEVPQWGPGAKAPPSRETADEVLQKMKYFNVCETLFCT